MRLRWIDSLRGFAIVLVTYGHALIGLGYRENPLRPFIYSFHMPLFFTISGFVLGLSWIGLKSRERLTLGWFVSYVWKKVTAILIPYLVWCLLITPVCNGKAFSLVSYKRLLTSVFVENTALWFLPTLFCLTMLYAVYVILRRNLRPRVLGGGDGLLSF